MAVASASVTVAATATLMIPAPGNGSGPGHAVYVEVANDSGVDIWVGPSNVTTTTGRKVANGSSWSWALSQGDSLYGVCASGTAAVIVFRGRA